MTRALSTAQSQQSSAGPTPPNIAGKNKLINGDFGVWQRGTSFTFADSTFAADRFKFVTNGGTDGTGTITQQTFTPGSAPVAGYESQYFLRYNLTATGTSTQHYMQQNIEDVRTFAGQTVTWSFWAKADSARQLNLQFIQRFGSGGSTGIVCSTATVVLSTTWTRYTAVGTFSSVSGKTIGSGSSAEVRLYWNTAAGTTIDFWGWQLEAGNQATPFHTATPNQQTELAACQRYYYRAKVASGFGTLSNYWFPNTTSLAYAEVLLPVPLRALPSAVEWGGNIGLSDGFNLIGGISSINVAGYTPLTTYLALTTNMSSASLTLYRGYKFADQGAGTAYLGISAEL